jgi:hypothetical protein
MSKIMDELVNGIDLFDTYNEDSTDEEFIAELPAEIIMNSVDTQFSEPLEYRKKDYVQDFMTKYYYELDNNEMENDNQDVYDMRDNFISFMCKIFDKYLDIGFVNIEDMDAESQFEIIHNTYRFFIKNIKKNFTNIVLNEITNNMENIASEFDTSEDVTYISFKMEIDDENLVRVLSNLSKITSSIFTKIKENYTIYDFFKNCDSGDPLFEKSYVEKMYDKIELTGNFVEKYCNMVESYFYDELESKVVSRLLKNYPDRKVPKIKGSKNITTDSTESAN